MTRLHFYCKTGMSESFARAQRMGDSALTTLSSATADEGRARLRTVDNPKLQALNAFNQNEQQRFIDGSKVAVTLEELAASSPAPFHVSAKAKHYGGGFYDPSNNIIGHDAQPDLNALAHEIGHAKLQQTSLGKLLHNSTMRGLGTYSPLIGAGLGVITPVKGSTSKRLLKSLLIALGLNAPTLLGEGLATYKGHTHLKQLGADPEQLKEYRWAMLPQLTYLQRPALAAGAHAYTSSIFNKLRKHGARTLARKTTFRDFDISIETDKGDYRHWYDTHNKTEGKTLMKYPYGYIRGTKGMDGDHVDCFLGPDETAENVYVVTSNKAPTFKVIDEQKCFLGFKSEASAKEAFLEHYSDSRFFNSIKSIPYEEFKTKAYNTLASKNKKISSLADFSSAPAHTTGPMRDSTPGDYLGFPANNSAHRLRRIEGDPLHPKDKINNMFKFHDQDMNTRTIESATPASSPGI